MFIHLRADEKINATLTAACLQVVSFYLSTKTTAGLLQHKLCVSTSMCILSKVGQPCKPVTALTPLSVQNFDLLNWHLNTFIFRCETKDQILWLELPECEYVIYFLSCSMTVILISWRLNTRFEILFHSFLTNHKQKTFIKLEKNNQHLNRQWQ